MSFKGTEALGVFCLFIYCLVKACFYDQGFSSSVKINQIRRELIGEMSKAHEAEECPLGTVRVRDIP